MQREDNRSLFYESARAELIARLGYRDTALIAYVPIIGGYFSFLLTQHFAQTDAGIDPAYAMLLMAPLPFICLTFTFIILQHHLVINDIAEYLALDLYSSFPPTDTPHASHWNNSRIYWGLQPKIIKYRLYAQATMLALPLVYIVPFGMKFWDRIPTGLRSWFYAELILEVVCSFSILAFHWFAHRHRKKSGERVTRILNQMR